MSFTPATNGSFLNVSTSLRICEKLYDMRSQHSGRRSPQHNPYAWRTTKADMHATLQALKLHCKHVAPQSDTVLDPTVQEKKATVTNVSTAADPNLFTPPSPKLALTHLLPLQNFSHARRIAAGRRPDRYASLIANIKSHLPLKHDRKPVQEFGCDQIGGGGGATKPPTKEARRYMLR